MYIYIYICIYTYIHTPPFPSAAPVSDPLRGGDRKRAGDCSAEPPNSNRTPRGAPRARLALLGEATQVPLLQMWHPLAPLHYVCLLEPARALSADLSLSLCFCSSRVPMACASFARIEYRAREASSAEFARDSQAQRLRSWQRIPPRPSVFWEYRERVHKHPDARLCFCDVGLGSIDPSTD